LFKKGNEPENQLDLAYILQKERVRMKRFAGVIVLMMLAVFMSGCHTQHCPHGNCTEEASPKPPEK
jgi:hypothetical protein